jgi:Leucine-rich repeat (LRR) protein
MWSLKVLIWILSILAIEVFSHSCNWETKRIEFIDAEMSFDLPNIQFDKCKWGKSNNSVFSCGEKKIDKICIEIISSDLNKFPNEIFSICPVDFVKLMNNNKLSKLVLTDFNKAKNLTKLIITTSNITTLQDSVFKEAPNLQYLSLTSCGIKDVAETTFKGAEKLIGLYLKDNDIESLAQNTFNQLLNLKFLDLTNNFIEVVNFSLIENTNLEKVSLKSNNIKSIKPCTFDNKPKLIMADFKENECIKFDDTVVKNNELMPLKRAAKKCFANFKGVTGEIYLRTDEVNFKLEGQMSEISSLWTVLWILLICIMSLLVLTITLAVYMNKKIRMINITGNTIPLNDMGNDYDYCDDLENRRYIRQRTYETINESPTTSNQVMENNEKETKNNTSDRVKSTNPFLSNRFTQIFN